MQFAFEPYPGRNASSVMLDIAYLHSRFISSPDAWFRHDGLPVMYVYDSYHISSDEWAPFLSRTGSSSIRGTPHDSCLIGLWLNRDGGDIAKKAGFDGIYGYFSSDGFTYGSIFDELESNERVCQQEWTHFFCECGAGI